MRTYFICFVTLGIIACGNPKDKNTDKKAPDSVTMIPTDTMIQTMDTSITPSLVESWKSYEAFNGKYAFDVKLLQQHPLKSRIKHLLGEDEKEFMLRYKVTPPIEVESGILFNEGCKPHDCTVEEAAIAIDMRKDVIYIGIARNKAVKLYGERGDSAYPEKLLQWMMKFENEK